MTTETPLETLHATNGQWRVVTYRDGNRRRPGPTVIVRAGSLEVAEGIGRSVTGARHASAAPYRPWEDGAFRGFIRRVEGVNDA